MVWEHPLEEGMATHSSILAWRIPWTEERSLAGYGTWGCKELGMTEVVACMQGCYGVSTGLGIFA